MVILRAFEAMIAGLALMALLLGAERSLLARLVPEWAGSAVRWPFGALLVHLGSTLLASAAGGYLTAWIGSDNPLRDVLVLGVGVLVLGGLGALQVRGAQPVLYQLLLVAIAPIGVLAGGVLRLRVLGLV